MPQYLCALDPETTRRKVREAVLAVKLERTEDKDQILERYLNTVYFGRGAYGVQAASRLYFGKPVNELSLEEAAMLAGQLDDWNRERTARSS